MEIISKPTYLLLSFALVPGVGSSTLHKIASQMRDGKSKEELLEQFSTLRKSYSSDNWAKACSQADAQVSQAEQLQVRIRSVLDEDFPSLVSEVEEAPKILWIKGCLSGQTKDSVAVIGPREATNHGLEITKRISRFFVEQNWSVVSGLALGCDSAAHSAALQAEGHTVAVMAHGLQTISPSKNRFLAHDILDKGGALVSEFPIGHPAKSFQFVQRDRTQAAMSRGVVMVQSDLKGGSLHAPRASLRYQRWVAVPYPTIPDLDNNESKIQASLVISNGSNEEKIKLLKCKPDDLQRIVILRGKEDYANLPTLHSKTPVPTQSSLV